MKVCHEELKKFWKNIRKKKRVKEQRVWWKQSEWPMRCLNRHGKCE